MARAQRMAVDDRVDVLSLHLLGHLEIERTRDVRRRPQRPFGQDRLTLPAAVAELHGDPSALRVNRIRDSPEPRHDCGIVGSWLTGLLKSWMDHREGHSDEAGAPARAFPVVGDVPLGREIVLRWPPAL